MKTKAHPNFQDLYSIEDIKKAESCLKETAYYPISLIFSHNQVSFSGNTGRFGNYDCDNTSERTYTLKAWYAVQVWNTAIAIASSSSLGKDVLPHWVDRDDSFKMLVNNEKFTN